MIHCKSKHHIAKLKAVFINGACDVKIAGSCKPCGIDERDDYPPDFKFTDIPHSQIDYDDFEELGVDA